MRKIKGHITLPFLYRKGRERPRICCHFTENFPFISRKVRTDEFNGFTFDIACSIKKMEGYINDADTAAQLPNDADSNRFRNDGLVLPCFQDAGHLRMAETEP